MNTYFYNYNISSIYINVIFLELGLKGVYLGFKRILKCHRFSKCKDIYEPEGMKCEINGNENECYLTVKNEIHEIDLDQNDLSNTIVCFLLSRPFGPIKPATIPDSKVINPG